jgi:hypothetical protein
MRPSEVTGMAMHHSLTSFEPPDVVEGAVESRLDLLRLSARGELAEAKGSVDIVLSWLA